jgi:5-carboxymethyl-2-hydroxymuconate isomerase
MPHLVVEYTGNLHERFDASALLATLNRELDAVGEFVTVDIKSRARRLERFVVGVTGREEAFVHVELAIMAGRSPQLKHDVVQRLLGVVREQIAAPPGLRTQMTVRIVDIDPHGYAKAIVSEGE